jgi:hypothetical protein
MSPHAAFVKGIAMNFRLVTGRLDVGQLLEQVDTVAEPWPKDPYWEKHKKGSVLYSQTNLVVRYIMAPLPYTRPIIMQLPAVRKVLFDVMHAIGGAILGSVVISKLRPGECILPHIDERPPNVFPLYHRFQIPLRTAPGIVFRCGADAADMQPGSLWWFNNQITHEVINDSNVDRISMFCDIAPL